jgi:hypothetical protein
VTDLHITHGTVHGSRTIVSIMLLKRLPNISTDIPEINHRWPRDTHILTNFKTSQGPLNLCSSVNNHFPTNNWNGREERKHLKGRWNLWKGIHKISISMLQGHWRTSPLPYRGALSQDYSVASFATPRVLSCLHSPGLRLSCYNDVRFCSDLEAHNLATIAITRLTKW